MQQRQEEQNQTVSRRQVNMTTNFIIYYFSFAMTLGILLELYYITSTSVKFYILRGMIEIFAVGALTLVQVKSLASLSNFCS